jgi:branched-chain amino acid transport system substrate-binding protein
MKIKFYLMAFLIFTVACSSLERRQQQRAPVARAAEPPPPPKSKIPSVSPEKLVELARKAFEAKDYNKAFDFYLAAGEMWTGKPQQAEAMLWADRSLIRANRYQAADDLAAELLSTRKWTDPIVSELTGYRYRALEALGAFQAALNLSIDAQNNPQLGKDREAYRMKAREIISSKLTVDELKRVSDDDIYGDLRAEASVRLGELALEAKETEDAKRYFSKAISVDPNSEWAPRAQDLLEQIESLRRVESKTIGVVLPMTGRYAGISQKTLRGVQMGLGLYNNYPSSFKLAILDSEGNPDYARRGVERLIKEDNVISVIGSVLSKTAQAVASKASELNVPSVALSQKAGITEVGETVFRNSLTSEMQVRYLVKTAMEDFGMKRFAILYPNDLYGVEFANIFWDEVKARGGTIVGAQTYSNKETDFRGPIQRLVGTYYLEGRHDEYKLRLKEWNNEQTKKSARNTAPDDLLPPIVDFDGLFVPDSAKSLGQISAMLSFNGIKDIHLMGTNLWNTAGIQKRAGHFAKNLLFVDSFISSEPRFSRSAFVRDYKILFGEDPGIFEIQGYDAALLLRQLISEGYSSRESLSRALADVKDFPGSIGPLSMTSEREIMRPLVALSLDTAGNITPVAKIKSP